MNLQQEILERLDSLIAKGSKVLATHRPNPPNIIGYPTLCARDQRRHRLQDANVTVTAFATKHAMESYGYRFDTPDRSIVISGDTNPTQKTIDACRGCDVLIHEANTTAWLATRPDTFQRFAAKYHSTTAQLAELAEQAKPRLLILYHYSSLSAEELFDDMLSRYSGHFVIGRDLAIY